MKMGNLKSIQSFDTCIETGNQQSYDVTECTLATYWQYICNIWSSSNFTAFSLVVKPIVLTIFKTTLQNSQKLGRPRS